MLSIDKLNYFTSIFLLKNSSGLSPPSVATEQVTPPFSFIRCQSQKMRITLLIKTRMTNSNAQEIIMIEILSL